MNILDVNIWTTPLTQFYVLDYSYPTYTTLQAAGLELTDVQQKAEYLQYVDNNAWMGGADNIENVVLSERYGEKLLKELEQAGVIVRFMAHKTVPRFHEEKWQSTNNIKAVK